MEKRERGERFSLRQHGPSLGIWRPPQTLHVAPSTWRLSCGLDGFSIYCTTSNIHGLIFTQTGKFGSIKASILLLLTPEHHQLLSSPSLDRSKALGRRCNSPVAGAHFAKAATPSEVPSTFSDNKLRLSLFCTIGATCALLPLTKGVKLCRSLPAYAICVCCFMLKSLVVCMR